jgi:hypothetical protein
LFFHGFDEADLLGFSQHNSIIVLKSFYTQVYNKNHLGPNIKKKVTLRGEGPPIFQISGHEDNYLGKHYRGKG